MNVIRFPEQNTLNTKVKQIRNPQKEISEGFFIFLRMIKYKLCLILSKQNLLQIA